MQLYLDKKNATSEAQTLFFFIIWYLIYLFIYFLLLLLLFFTANYCSYSFV